MWKTAISSSVLMEIQGHGVMFSVQGALSSDLSMLVEAEPKVQPGHCSHILFPWWPRNKEYFPEFINYDINYGLHGLAAGKISEALAGDGERDGERMEKRWRKISCSVWDGV